MKGGNDDAMLRTIHKKTSEGGQTMYFYSEKESIICQCLNWISHRLLVQIGTELVFIQAIYKTVYQHIFKQFLQYESIWSISVVTLQSIIKCKA